MGEPGLLRKTFFKNRAYLVLIFIYESKLKYKDYVTYRLSCVSVLYGFSNPSDRGRHEYE